MKWLIVTIFIAVVVGAVIAISMLFTSAEYITVRCMH
jgi:hypothetical protein